ncbi:MAG: T9SS type A sorting domain-containing protein [Lewinellaceae bacterium]|nr:T9SS type A sorting domain-containing protein [Lewinellaceae bacterium]
MLLADPSDAQHLGLVLAGSPNGDIDAMLLETYNGGANWQPLLRANDDPLGNGKMQDLVWGSFDLDGDLVMSWRDRRDGAGTGYQQPTKIYAAVKWKDSLNFAANMPLSDQLAPYNDLYLSQSGNDFMGVAMIQDTISAVWGDVRDGKLNIYFQRKAVNGGVSPAQQIGEEVLLQLYPNPTNGWLWLKGEKISGYTIYDASGRTWITGKANADAPVVDISTLPAGAYFVAVNSKFGNTTLKFIKE